MNNKYVGAELNHSIEKFLGDPVVTGYAKEMLQRGLNMDCLDAARDAQAVAAYLVQVRQDILGC